LSPNEAVQLVPKRNSIGETWAKNVNSGTTRATTIPTVTSTDSAAAAVSKTSMMRSPVLGELFASDGGGPPGPEPGEAASTVETAIGQDPAFCLSAANASADTFFCSGVIGTNRAASTIGWSFAR